MEQLGRYRILHVLGKGAMGVVYLADDPLLNRQVAVKTLDLAIDDPSRREFLRGRLLRDARAAAALIHPNIVSVFDVIAEGDTNAIIMEYVAGENLAAYLGRNPIADPAFTLRIVSAMASALDYTHARGVVHRDIKPANVMLDASQAPKITDFGIARVTDGATATMTGVVMGTIEYMAPEQVKGETVDGRADQFALAVVAYRMLTGKTLFGEHSLTTLAYKIVNEDPPPVRVHVASLPAAVDSTIAKALSKDPNQRYENCGAFAVALGAALRGIDRDAPTIAMPPTATIAAAAAAAAPALAHDPVPVKRTSAAAVAGLCSVAALAGAGLLWIWKPWAPSPPPALTPVVQQQAAGNPPAAVNQPIDAAPARKTGSAPKKNSGDAAPAPKADSTPAQPAPKTPANPPVAETGDDAVARGRQLMQKEDYAGALQAFTKASELRPNWAIAYHARGNAYEALGQYDAALHEYDHAIQLNPGVFSFYASRGSCYMEMHQDNRALADLNQALAIKAESPVALAQRAAIYMSKGDYQKALADWTGVIGFEPANARAYRQRAAARRELGDRAGARADVAKANQLAAQKGK